MAKIVLSLLTQKKNYVVEMAIVLIKGVVNVHHKAFFLLFAE